MLKIYYAPAEIMDWWRGQRADLTPPRRLMFVGPGDFHNIGNHMVHLFKTLGSLQPNEHVLDIGCGVGRMAVPLTKVLSNQGLYRGFDVVNNGIKWCQQNISITHTNFQFEHVDLFNKSYNNRGKLQAHAHQFAYKDGAFDFIFATSVFTHMLPRGLRQYLSESARVLKKGGRCFFTFFLLHPHSIKMIDEGRSSLPFRFEVDNYRVVDEREPEKAIAYQEDFICQLLKENGFESKCKIYYGLWARNPNALSYQDIIIASKK